jgi:hypothetical protein
LQSRIEQDEKKANEIDKKYLEVFNNNEMLTKEKAQKDEENANVSDSFPVD